MSANFRITVTYGAALRKLMGDAGAIGKQAQAAAIRAGAPYIQRVLAMNTPVGATGLARQSVIVEFSADDYAFVHYAAPASGYIGFVNDGTRPHMPPTAPLVYWAARKLGNPHLGYAVAHGIAAHGTKAQHFVENTVESERGKASTLMAEAAWEYLNSL